MPAASAEKKARQRANKLLRMETEATTTGTSSKALPPSQTAEITSESLFTPAPTFFTISYTPVSISYPEPKNSTATLPTDAIRVTRDQLADMLHQSYIHGSEFGWKTHFALANDRLRASYDQQHLKTLFDMSERCQEYHEAGIREERERWESARASLVDVATQTDSTTTISVSVQAKPTMATASVQSNPPSIPISSTATISTQTEPLLPTVSFSESSPVPIFEPTIPATTSPAPFNWSDDAVSLSTIPILPLKQPRDLSGLRSSSKNPFSSLRRRHHYSKRPQIFSSCHHTCSYPTHLPLHHTPPFCNNPLDWHRDPRLFELSHVLKTLGWSRS
jgi:hypothetical protein